MSQFEHKSEKLPIRSIHTLQKAWSKLDLMHLIPSHWIES